MSKNEVFWVRTQRDKTHYQYTCTNCHKTNRHHKYTYCPFCGSRMVTDIVLDKDGNIAERAKK